MTTQKNVDKSGTADVPTDEPAADAEATILAGGVVVGSTVDDEPLVEGPNSK